ncbi:hypothetical protein AWB81_05521 [Caballeronia arationis]|jgi:hypothetical protein|uniref:Uncharacterized protein n=1 Tax=Caballeronia arationis TaxID=1777142 RepID=A0A7Z7I8N8_9BURK|nr:hypothetical protein [Caballeronia arationis]SAK97853.1 hypothetical protein AWB81_05521 [Caballeronia arationis]SOE81359.1 hypothetical protein SAMN05446927_4638 [Caballeronia arationis]
MEHKKIGRFAAGTLPPRKKIPPSSGNPVDMSTPEARERVMEAVRKVISTHNVAIKELAKR